jgi:hypothetical protein
MLCQSFQPMPGKREHVSVGDSIPEVIDELEFGSMIKILVIGKFVAHAYQCAGSPVTLKTGDQIHIGSKQIQVVREVIGVLAPVSPGNRSNWNNVTWQNLRNQRFRHGVSGNCEASCERIKLVSDGTNELTCV